MNKLKENLAIKVTAFILLVIMLMITATCAAGSLFNLGSQWYSKDADWVREDINHRVADSIAYELYSYDGELYGENAYHESKEQRGAFDYEYYTAESPGQENTKWKLLDKAKTEEIQNNCVYTETFEYDWTAKVVVYLADPSYDSYGRFQQTYKFYDNIYNFRVMEAVGAIAGIIVSIYLFVFLMAAAGRKDGTTKLSPFDRIPIDLYAVIAGGICAIIIVLWAEAASVFDKAKAFSIVACLALGAVGTSVLLGFLMSLAVRIKQGKWWKNSILYRLVSFMCSILRLVGNACKSVFRLLKKIPLVKKTAGAFAIVAVMQLLSIVVFCWTPAVQLILWLMQTVGLGYLIIYTALGMKKIKDGGKRLASGELDWKIDTKGLFMDLAEHADDLNSIGEGMTSAVKEQMKSEHFKTELITNVSHDIKTPLTSIINYVDLLKKETIEDETIQEYIEVLDRQSQRMKKLTDDLVEASKAATGAVKMEIMPCEAAMLIGQAIGEYEERAREHDLKIVAKMPEKELMIMADGKRLWRVFDNMLSNVCKYAQPGTRVYIDLFEEGDNAVIIFKNISRYELNITEEELMERFVRGDSSRHTDGSGLGLSISRNLMELQKGSLDLHVDGDLFKVILRIKKVKKSD